LRGKGGKGEGEAINHFIPQLFVAEFDRMFSLEPRKWLSTKRSNGWRRPLATHRPKWNPLELIESSFRDLFHIVGGFKSGNGNSGKRERVSDSSIFVAHSSRSRTFAPKLAKRVGGGDFERRTCGKRCSLLRGRRKFYN